MSSSGPAPQHGQIGHHGGAGETAACDGCGTAVAEPPATWAMQVTDRGVTWLCEVCTRENLRSIEAKLDEAWW